MLLTFPLLAARQAVTTWRRLADARRVQRSLATRLIDERERERARIAADIHDVVLQDLAALQLITENVREAIRLGRVAESAALARQLEAHAASAIAGMRATIASLRPATLDDAGLAATLARDVRSFSAHSGIDVALDAGDVNHVPPATGQLIYECAREALTNIARHARATRAMVTIRPHEGAVELTVVDDGIGPPAVDVPGRGRTGGSGIALMREKVDLAGGSLAIGHALGRGTRLRVWLPLWSEH